ncbi:MAG: cytochrome P450 [Gammaproteobacteria bacterium]|nr:cytochrome P450 [Gammaproteobacteria bacterium]
MVASIPSSISTPVFPPGPAGSGKLGCLPEMRQNPMVFLQKVAEQYGGIARIDMGEYYSYLVSEPKLIKEVLVDNFDKYKKNTRYKQVRMVIGEGMLLSEGMVWKQQRTHAQPKFTAKALNTQLDWISRLAARSIDSWKKYAEAGKPIELEYEFNLLTQLLAGVWVMGQGFEKRAETVADIYNQIRMNWPEMTDLKDSMLNPKNLKKAANFRRALMQLDRCVYELLEEYPSIMNEDIGFLKHLLAEGEDPAQWIRQNKRSLRDQVLTLFVTAFETTATSLCWTLYVIDQYPEVKQRITEELKAVLGEQALTPELLNKLEYTEKVIKESLRLYSSVHSFSRVALEDHLIGGYRVPKDTTVIISSYVTHRLAQYWEEPDRFDPERFDKKRSVGRSRFAYIPFAAGHRNCIGSHMALMQSKLVVALIMQRYALSLTAGHVVEPQAATTMRPKYGMKMDIRCLAA